MTVGPTRIHPEQKRLPMPATSRPSLRPVIPGGASYLVDNPPPSKYEGLTSQDRPPEQPYGIAP